MPGAHSILSPSSAKRWSECTASVQAIIDADLPEDNTADSVLGTITHEWGEKILRGQITPAELPDEFKHVLVYTEYCQALHNRWGGEFGVEVKVPLYYLPEDTGTVDFRLISDGGLFIVDYKNGIGEPVDAEGNPQMGTYAMSVIEDPNNSLSYDFPDNLRVEMAIVQPRYQGAEPIKVWTTTVGELRDYMQPYYNTAGLILDARDGCPQAQKQMQFRPSYDACRWCDLRRVCTYRSNAASEAISTVAEVNVLEYLEDETALDGGTPDLELVLNRTLTDKQLLGLFNGIKFLTAYLKDVKKEVENRAANGNPLPGTKVVLGRQGNRAWADDNAVMALINTTDLPMDQAGDWKLKSPAQLKKSYTVNGLKAPKELDNLTVRKDGRPQVVPESDPRPAVLDVSTLFTDEDTEDTEESDEQT